MLTAFVIVATTAIIQAARTLANSVPIGSHLSTRFLPSPCPLSLAKRQRIHTPGGPTKKASQRTAELLRSARLVLNNSPLTTHNKHQISRTVVKTATCLLRLSTLHFSRPHVLILSCHLIMALRRLPPHPIPTMIL